MLLCSFPQGKVSVSVPDKFTMAYTTNTSHNKHFKKELIPRTAVQREFAREETIGHFQYYNFVSCLLCKVVLRSLKKFVLCRSNQANTKEMKEETGYVCRAADVIS